MGSNVDGPVGVIRTFDPPRAVQMGISRALPLGRGGAARADYVIMRVKSSSVDLSGLRPALQTHWFQLHDGQ